MGLVPNLQAGPDGSEHSGSVGEEDSEAQNQGVGWTRRDVPRREEQSCSGCRGSRR